jgi:MFS family permease
VKEAPGYCGSPARAFTLSPSRIGRDIVILFCTRTVRLFAYGLVSVILVLYLAEIGISPREIGLLLTMTLVGDTIFSLWITTVADRLGRKRMLIVGATLMALGGLGFALTTSFLPLLVAATIGVISPSGNEVGPFLAIEQAALTETVSAEQRTRFFAWYQLAGSLATAVGSLVCGWLVELLETHGMSSQESFRVVFLAYAGAGLLIGLFFIRLSPAAEVNARVGQGIAAVRKLLGLHRSRRVVAKLSALFALDAFAGGFVLQSVMVYWFHIRFDADAATLGTIFFGANILAGISALAAARIARRFGLINTMVFTHVPSNILLILVPLMPNLPLAVAVLLLRFAVSQMDVPTRQSYTAAVVEPDERSAAAGITGVARTTGASLAPMLTGPLLSGPLAGGPFIIAGVLKLVYDGLLYRLFSKTRPPEEIG